MNIIYSRAKISLSCLLYAYVAMHILYNCVLHHEHCCLHMVFYHTVTEHPVIPDQTFQGCPEVENGK